MTPGPGKVFQKSLILNPGLNKIIRLPESTPTFWIRGQLWYF